MDAVRVFRLMETTELCLNVPGYIPFLSNISSELRRLMACVQVVGAGALLVVALANPEQSQRHLKLAVVCGFHGLLNLGRSGIEKIPIVGNGILIAYDAYQAYSLKHRIFVYTDEINQLIQVS